MCLAVYLASAEPLRGIEGWRDTPTINLRPLERREASVRAQFSHPYVYYVGSHTGCGCGFSADDPANAPARERTVADLVAIMRAVPSATPFELLPCWEGDQRKAPLQRLQFAVAELATRSDWSKERTFSTIVRAG